MTDEDEEFCAVIGCGIALGGPLDRDGWCSRCADEIEAMEREEREREVER